MRHNAKLLLAALLLLGFVSAFDQPAGTKLWEFYTGTPIQSSPGIGADGTVYFGADNGKLYAFDPLGSGKWEFPTGEALVSSPAIAADGTVIVGSMDGYLYAVGSDGIEKWRFRSNGKIVSSPAIGQSNSVFFGTMQKTLYAVNSEGMKRWELELDDSVVSSPAVGRDGTVYVASLSGVLYAVDFWGKVKWKFKASEKVNSSPAIGPDGTIYFGAFDGHVYAIKPGGQKKWTFATGAAVRGSASVGPDGVVYIGSDDRKLYAFAPDGFKLWTYSTGGWVRSTPAVSSDGTIYVGSYDNSLHAVTKAGTKAWEFATDSAISSSPALTPNGVIYFGGWSKRFYAVKGGEGLAANAWARFRGDARQTAAQLEPSPMQFAQPAVRPAFPVEDQRPLDVTSKAAAAEEFARAQAAREAAMAAKKDSSARAKAAVVPPPVAPKPVDTSAEAKRLAKLQAEADAKAARDAREAEKKAEAEANRKMFADNAQVLKEAELARKAQADDDQRRALSAADLARNAKRDAALRDAASRKAAEDAERQAKAQQEIERKAQAAEAARKASEAKAQAEADRRVAMETARLTKLQQDAERKAAAQAEIEKSKLVLEESRNMIKAAAEARNAEAAAAAHRAVTAAELARLAKKEADERVAAKQATELAERKAQEAAAAREQAEARAKAELEAKAAIEAERLRLKEQEITRKVAADADKAAREETERQAREAAREQAAERRRIEAERQKWEPVQGGFFRRLFGGGSAEPKAKPEPVPAATTEPAAPEKAAADLAETKRLQAEAEVAEAARRKAERETELQAKAQAEADRKAAMETARQTKQQQAAAAQAEAAERRRVEAERQKFEPVQGGFFQRLFGGGSSKPKPEAPAAAPTPVPVPPAPAPAPVAVAPVAPPPPAVTIPAASAPNVPLRIISDSSELVRAPEPAPPATSFFSPTQPTVDPLADQIELLKQRAAAAQPQVPPPVAQPVVPQVPVAQGPQPVAETAAEPAQPEKPGFWSRVGGFFIRSKKDQQAQSGQPPARPVAQWPPANIVVRDPKAPAAQAQVPAGVAPGGITATNFPRVQYAPVTNQNGLFLSRAIASQTNIPGMPQPPAPPREVREMRPGKTGTQGLAAELPGSVAPIEIIQGRVKAVLRVYATGAGRVVPDLNGAELEVGQVYTVEAQPARGSVFLGWTGSIETNSPVLRFIMRTGTMLSANFQFGYNMEREVPEVAIVSPAEGARLASPVLTVQGAARDNMAVARVEVSLNGGPWEPVQGTDNWVFQGTARPGANFVHVRAVDQAGNESQPLLRSLYYSVPSVLTVRVNGAGIVEPDWNGRLLDVAGAYEMRATPAAGHVFTGWSGGVSGVSPLLQFNMQTNLVVEANFAPRVASLARGVFNGLVYPTNSLLPAKCGFFQLEVGADGAFAGFLRQGIASHPLSGRFDVNGQAATTVTRAGQTPVTLSLQLDTTAGERLMGRFDDDGTGIAMFAYRQVFDGQAAVSPLAGRYTFVMPSPTNSVNSPGGDAFGEIVVDGAGRVKFAGELPDGTPVRHEASMGRNGLWPLHVPLAGGRGMLLGWITVSKDPNLDAFGELIWHKPLSPQDRYYPAGFSTRRLLFGNLYTPAGSIATSGGRNVGGMLSGGNLDKVVLGDSVLPLTSASPLYATLSRFNWTFRPDSGFVEGSFIHPATQQETSFRGALLQKRGWTSGYFLGQNHSGVVHLQLPQ